MAAKRRTSSGPRFGEDGGSNLTEYFGLAGRTDEADRQLESGERILSVPVARIDPSPYQTRVHFDADELNALAEDIERSGLGQPVTLRPKAGGRYELVAGERRWRAVRIAGLETIEARVRDLDDFAAHLAGISENNQRANLSPWEKALEALELQRHAEAAGRPHAQRDLVRYLNRNVAIVNQQLAIARAITADVLECAKADAGDMCQLPHETLHRVAKVTAEERPRALNRSIQIQRSRKAPAARKERGADASALPVPEPQDPWTRFWERGGLQLHIRKPLRDLEPAKARKYVQDLLPGIAGLATRAAQENGGAPLLRWEHDHGQLVFIWSPAQLSTDQRNAAKEALARIIARLEFGP